MNSRILSRSAIVLGVLAGLAAAPAMAAESILVLHDEGNSGPAVVSVDQSQHASAQHASTQTASAPHEEVVLRDEGMTSPEVTFH